MSDAPMRIQIDGQELTGFTSATLSRKKSDMTGSLSVEIFFSYVPNAPVYVQAVRGREITVYVNDQLAFTGILDKREGAGVKQNRDSQGRFTSGSTGGEGGDVSSSIGPDKYRVTLSARGKTKYLVDSSHQISETMLQTKSHDVAKRLTQDFDIEVDWQAQDIDIDKKVFRDGSLAMDEIFRLCNEHCYFVYETRDGRLRICEKPDGATGEPLILGKNIISFSAEQSEERANSKIKIKGHRHKKGIRGKDAIIEREKEIEDHWVEAYIPLTIQHYGDATDEALERRGKWEADRRSAESKRVTIEVFDMKTASVFPWDIGLLHYVEVPPEGIFDTMECIELEYKADGESCRTTLTLAPPPSKSISGGSGVSGGETSSLTGVDIASEILSTNTQRRAQAGVQIVPGFYPSSWTSADLSVVNIIPNVIGAIAAVVNSLTDDEPTKKKQRPPLKIRPKDSDK